MRLMHTSLPEFKYKMQGAILKGSPDKKLEIKGLESLKSAKMQSLRTGRIENAVEEIAMDKKSAKVEVVVMPRVPETMHTVIIKGYDKEENPTKAVLEVINIIHPTEEVHLDNFEDIDDRRPGIGRH